MNSMIQTVDLTKKFNDFVANDHINLDVKEQEIKCIVGENGAGKSTMMNMLYGLLQPTSGKILIRGKEVTLNSPVDAIANGIGMVHQHFKLVPSLTVYENILLGAEITQKKGGMKTPFIDQKEEIKRVEKLIQENHLELNATDKIEDISVGGRQRVEILKMLYRNVDILILDGTGIYGSWNCIYQCIAWNCTFYGAYNRWYFPCITWSGRRHYFAVHHQI